MESTNPLKGLLQVQLASDASAVLHLPYVLEILSAEQLQPSQHTHKWCARINSLLHSRDPSVRWSGLCLALQTSIYSRSIMLDHAAGWLGVALPLLSKAEPLPNVKAAVRLLRRIFSSAMDVPEYQRQICLPNVPKFSASLISLVDRHPEQEVKLLALDTLTHLVPLFPTLHRSLHQQLSSSTLRFLNGSTPRTTPISLVDAASRLYSVVHVTGGKVGSANVWRKALDDTLSFAWSSLASLRGTSRSTVRGQGPPQLPGVDTTVSIPLGLERLRAAVRILCELVRAPTPRPVTVPVGPLVQLCLAMLGCTLEEKPVESYVDSSTRSMELAVVPSIWLASCELLETLAGSMHCHLVPYFPQLVSHIAYHLEQQRTTLERLSFLQATRALLEACPHLHDSTTVSRLARAVAPSVVVLLSTKSQAQQVAGTDANARIRKGKKRARGYEGDEVFNVTAEVICADKTDGDVLLTSIDAIRLVLRNPQLPLAVRSLLSRLLLAVYVSLPLMQPSHVSVDLSLHGLVYERVRNTCVEQASGTSNVLSKSQGIVVSNLSGGRSSTHEDAVLRDIDLLLHPRVPPLVRSLPHVEMLSLFREEEGDEELGMRKSLGLATADESLLTLPSSLQRPEVPPEPVAGPSVPTLGRAEPVANSSIPGQFATSIRQLPQVQISLPTPHAPQPIVSRPAATQMDAITTSSTSYISAASNQESDSSHGQGPPLSSHPTPPAQATPTAASYASVIQPPITGTSTAPTATSALEPRELSRASALMDEDKDDEDEPMPAINMDSDSDDDTGGA